MSNNDNSDYNLQRTQLHKLLPDPYDSDANSAIFENLFNRFLTKSETKRVAGYIGEGNPNALISRQLSEPTLTRQANQLQPMLYSKIGSVEHMKTWSDTLLELARLGVDIDRLPEWGSAQVFNWVPPVDIDKVVNFRDYFWTDTTTPEYITIKNRCTTLDARLSFFQRVIDNNGDRFPIQGIDAAPTGSPANYNAILVSGDYTHLFEENLLFRVVNSTNLELNNIDVTVISSTYNSVIDRTTIVIDTFFATPTADGEASIREIRDQLEVDRDEQCGVNPPQSPTITSANQWIERNKWVHRTNVVNFSSSIQAEVPIIEFDADLELNEWTHTTHNWAYRSQITDAFISTTSAPPLIELTPLVYTITGTTLLIDEQFGNQTSTFAPGAFFENDSSEFIEVISSTYKRATTSSPYRTEVIITSPVSVGSVQPVATSQGEVWLGYDQHWLYLGESSSTAISHPTINPFINGPVSGTITVGTTYSYVNTPYTQTYTTLSAGVQQFELTATTQPGWQIPPRQLSIKDTNDVRVYVDGVRTVGNYVELTELEMGIGTDEAYVAGILFNATYPIGTIVRIELAEAAFDEIGLASVLVRTSADNVLYDTSPSAATTEVSLIGCRKVEQIKSDTNQYPQFDIYNVDGTSALIANHIFGYETSPEADVNPYTNKRLVVDEFGLNFSLQQLLLGDDDELLAYRNYQTNLPQYWMDTDTATVMFWTGYRWSVNGFQGDTYGQASVADTSPVQYEGRVWYDTFGDRLNQSIAGSWVEITDVVVGTDEPSLQTIWRKGLNNERYTPQQVDWKNRTAEEYLTEQEEFIAQYIDTVEGQSAWIEKQKNPLSPTGVWVGDWEIPDPLYFNNQHENRAILDSSELLAHFNSIKASQPTQPGIPGATGGRWHSIPYEDINFGVGGHIHEYNGNFDTLLSSGFVNNVTPPTLFEFARDQYEALLNSLRELMRNNLYDQMISTTATNIVNFSSNATAAALETFDQNDNFSSLYGDSTTFTDNIDADDIGQRNWIATLPFLNLSDTAIPNFIKDDVRGISEVTHHDGHRRTYTFAPATIDGIIRRVLVTVDDRSTLSAPNNKLGVQKSTPPPLNTVDFATEFNESIDNRHGVFWYETTTTDRTPYRLVLAGAGTSQPSTTLPDGSLWMDMTVGNGTLRIKNGLTWDVVLDVNNAPVTDGVLHNGSNPADDSDATIKAWQVFSMNTYLADLIISVENNLKETAPAEYEPVFDFGSLTATTAGQARYDEALEQQFLDFVRQSEIALPFRNLSYSVKDAFTWNYKRSAPGQTYGVISSTAITNTILLEGLQASNFASATPGSVITVYIKNSGINDGTWSVQGAVEIGGNTELSIVEPIQDALSGLLYVGQLPSLQNSGSESAADWRGLYAQLYNTPYPHLEPWKLQGFSDKPTWWDITYAEISPLRRWKYDHLSQIGMWTQIGLGAVPTGELLPNGVSVSTGAPGEVQTYSYFSVNLTNDELLPPFFDHTAAGELAGSNYRSVFSNLSEVNSPAADYAFGDKGPIEMDWRLSSQFAYDQLTVAYSIEPLKVIGQTYGFDELTVGGLVIDNRTAQTPAHNRTIFHGEVLSNGEIFKADGLNQWYVNYNRYQGFDPNLSDFRRMWTNWTAPLTYQLSAFVDTASFQLGHRTVPVSEFDYEITSKKSPGVEDYWVHGLNITTISVPPRISQYNNENEWVFQLDINSPLTQPIEYYGVQKYQFLADTTTGICSLYTYDITAINFFNEGLTIIGDQTVVFGTGRTLTLFGSTGNDGNYTVANSVYDATADTTLITVTTPLITPTADGQIKATYRAIPWETGDSIWITADRHTPAPLIDVQRGVGLIEYYIIKVSDTEFKVANTKAAALADLHIELTSPGVGNAYVSQLHTTFRALDGRTTGELWRHHKLDLDTALTITPPTIIRGMQTLVDIIDGYAATLEESGIVINGRVALTDPDTGRPVSWQVEIERFINDTYQLKDRRDINIGNRFAATVDANTNTWNWTDQMPQLQTGDPISVMTSTGEMPTPILPAIRYFVIIDSASTFRIANTRLEAIKGNAISISSEATGALLTIYKAQEAKVIYPQQEINPFRNAVFFTPPRGIVSNMITGPTEDIRSSQLLFDQYGRPLDKSNTRIFREDTQTYIQCIDGIENQRDPSFGFDNPYGYLHIGGAHLFIDAYEHVLIFNNATTESDLIYDPFIGLNVTKFELQFNRQRELTERPNIGGSYYTTFFNQGASFADNFEASVESIRYMYDVSQSDESKPMTIEARKALGYEGSASYLTDMNLNDKSQFSFWRGLIQNKGSVESVSAFINSRRFIDANVDEFWAYKIADFGSVLDQEFPELYVTTDDIRSNDFRILFTESADLVPGFGLGGFSPSGAGYDLVDVTQPFQIQDGVTPISVGVIDRWYNQPDVLNQLKNQGDSLYFDLEVKQTVLLSDPAQAVSLASTTVRHGFQSDFESVTLKTQATTASVTAIAGQTTITLTEPYLPGTGQITVFKNGSEITFEDYQQLSPVPPTLFSFSLGFFDALAAGDVITVVYGTATLETSTHFDHITADVIRFKQAELIDPTFVLNLWGYQVDSAAQNPAKLMDRANDTVVSAIQLWDPARGLHYQRPLPIINIEQDRDPAQYTNSVNTASDHLSLSVDPWNFPEVGHVWFDTSRLGYVPYYDYKIFTLDTDRLDKWGRLADWAEIKLYEWVESDVHPDDYNEIATEEEGNKEIPEHLRKSGRVKETLFKLNANEEWVILDDTFQEFTTLDDGTVVTGNPSAYEFTLSDTVLGLDPTNIDQQYVSIYVNGTARISPTGLGFEVPTTRVMQVEELTPNDTVRFIHFKPHEQDIISGIDEGIYRRDVEHTQISYVDSFGQTKTRYYFWVEDKVTRNLTQAISPRDAQTQLTTIPAPYMITSNEKPAEVRTDEIIDVDRSWSYILESSDLTPTTFGAQILGQTEGDFNGVGTNGTFIGGDTNPIFAYDVGYLITMSNDAVIQVDEVDAAGDVTKFNILFTPQSSNTTTGSYTQVSVTDELSAPVGSTGFILSNDAANVNSTTHTITLGSIIKNRGKTANLIVGSTEATFAGSFDPGSLQSIATASFNIGDVITLSNNALILVDAIDDTGVSPTGDVTAFTVIDAGDPFVVNTILEQTLVTPIGSAPNTGFRLVTNNTNTDVIIDPELISVYVDGRQLDNLTEYTIDRTGRLITIKQTVGAITNSTVGVEYVTSAPNQVFNLPIRHVGIVIRGLRRFVTEDRRFTIRFTRDFTLRDNLSTGTTDLTLKQNHEEWTLIREEQPTKIFSTLWDRITESMIGYKLTDATQPVPALNRQLYDLQYDTDTQYGLGDEQSFTNGPVAIDTITKELFNPNVQLDNVDLDQFLTTRNFDSPENIITTMNDLYDQLSAADVNRLFFAVLHDAVSFKKQYSELFKTSMIAVHGIRPFQVSGLFDD